MRKTLVYIDPGYRVDFGHFTRMGELIRDEAKKSGIELEHYVSLDVPQDKADELGLIRRFEYVAGLPWLEDSSAALYNFFTALDDILSELAERKEDKKCVLFMYTAHPLHLPVLALLANKYRQNLNGLSAYGCLFYLDAEFCQQKANTDEYVSMLKGVSSLLEISDPLKLLNICTDSERTKHIYNQCFERDLSVLPIPIENITSLKESKRRADGKITLGYIGQTTRRAGYDLVYGLYKEFVERGIIDKVHFKVKHTPRDQLKDLYEQFTEESQNITHIKGFIADNEEYEDFFSTCDVILITYSKRFYPCQTSGIVTEALCRKKIVVVPEDTWLSGQIKDYGSGETFISDDLESLIEAVEKIVNNFGYYSEKRGRNIEKYRQLHSSNNLLKEIALMEGEKPDKAEKEYRSPVDDEARFENMAMKQISLLDKLEKSGEKIKNRDAQIKNRDAQIQAMKGSLSWRVSLPIRWLGGLFVNK